MAAPVSTLIQVVRPHIPRISFPKKGGLAKAAVKSSSAGSTTKVMSVAPPVSVKPPGASIRGSGINPIDLPARYRRKPLDQSEIDAIMRGGGRE